jgi:hypothetical protein
MHHRSNINRTGTMEELKVSISTADYNGQAFMQESRNVDM